MLKSKIALTLLSFTSLFPFMLNGQSLQWSAFAGPTYSPFRFEKTIAGQNDFKLKIYPGVNLGTDFVYLRKNGWGFKTGLVVNLETFSYYQIPFPSDEINGGFYDDLSMAQVALLLDLVKQFKPADRDLTFYGGLTLNMATAMSVGDAMWLSKSKDDTIKVETYGTGNSDTKSYYSLGFNLGVDFTPFKAAKYFALGIQYNAQLSTATYLESQSHYDSPYSGINYVRELKTYQRPNFLMLSAKLRLWSNDKSQPQE